MKGDKGEAIQLKGIGKRCTVKSGLVYSLAFPSHPISATFHFSYASRNHCTECGW